MRDATEGWVAAALGSALLLGTGGTFALWTGTGTIEGTRIVVGSMTLDDDGFDWTVTSRGVQRAVQRDAGGRAVFDVRPGDRIVGTATIAAALDGPGLDGTVHVPRAAVTVNGVAVTVNGAAASSVRMPGVGIVSLFLQGRDTVMIQIQVEGGAPAGTEISIGDIEVTFDRTR